MVSHDYIGKGRGLPKLGGGLTPRRRWLGAVVGGAAARRADAGAGGPARAHDPRQRRPLYLRRRRGRRPGRRPLPGPGRRRRPAPCCSTGISRRRIHSFTIYSVDNVVALIVYRRRRRPGQRRRRSRCPAHRGGRPGQRRGGDAVHACRQPAARRAGAAGAAATRAGNVRDDRRQPAAAHQRCPGKREAPRMRSRTGLIAGNVDVPGERRRPAVHAAGRGRHRGAGRSTDLALVLRGRPLPAEDRRVLAAFAAEVGRGLSAATAARSSRRSHPGA